MRKVIKLFSVKEVYISEKLLMRHFQNVLDKKRLSNKEPFCNCKMSFWTCLQVLWNSHQLFSCTRLMFFVTAKLCVDDDFAIIFSNASLSQYQSLVKSFAYQTLECIVLPVCEHIKSLKAASIKLMNMISC